MNLVIEKKNAVLLLILFITFLFATFKISESPTIWLDEGIITQVARNMAEHSIHALQESKGEYVSAGFVTTGYPVTLPVALSFKLFGIGIVQARAIMVLFILLFFIAIYFLLRNVSSATQLVLALALAATFSPVYGHGKNVLGEIPGMFFLISGLYLVQRIERGDKKWITFLLAGLAFGITVSTKPVFIVVLPALVLALFLLRDRFTWKNFSLFLLGFAAPVLFWLYIQFSNDSFTNILSIYVNPHSNDFAVSFKENFLRFFTEATPIYCAFTMLVWLISIGVRMKNKAVIPRYEILAVTFSLFILGAYLRTPGYYRYFFEAQILSIIFLPSSLLILSKNALFKNAAKALIVLLVVFQTYQTMFNSWAADFYGSHRTEWISNSVKSIGKASVFFYKTPEVVLFLPHDNYSQYMEVTKTIHIGTKKLEELTSASKDFVVTYGQFYDARDRYLEKYDLACRVDRYVILKRKNGDIMPITCAI
jgi:4-amino-4-deoxy-L-arabinose transferase-like glycosyltransferase